MRMAIVTWRFPVSCLMAAVMVAHLLGAGAHEARLRAEIAR